MVTLPFRKKEGGAPGSKPARATIRYPFVGAPLPANWKVADRYPLNAPFTYAVIAEDPSSSTRKYFVDEVTLSPREASIYTYLLETLESELSVPRSEIDPRAYFLEQAKKIVKKYSIKASQLSWPKINYFAERDLVGFGVIDGVMRDTQIEDITVDGVGKPLFIYHRRYDNIETNLNFLHDEELDNIIARLAHMAGKHVSTAFPIVQGTLPGRHRLAATYRREVSPYGGTLTIRKFREDPLTIVDMMNLNVIDSGLAAYVWLLMENRATAIVCGSTGSGKTTLLNALLTLTRMNSKIVTIEEVQEINIAHSNWSALVSRESYGASSDSGGEVGLFQLVKATMRMRPDILVVGEVRGEEAYVLFQAISSMTGDTPVLVRENGSTDLVSIGSLVDRFYSGDAERVPVPVRGIEVLSFDNDKRVRFQPVSYVLRHRTDEIYSLRYPGGEVRATGSHSVFVVNDDAQLVEKQVSDLSPGESLVSFRDSQIVRKAPVIDVEATLRKTDPHRVLSEKRLPICPGCDSKEVWKRGQDKGVQRYSCKVCGRSFKRTDDLTYHDALEAGDGVARLSFARSFTVPAKLSVDARFARVLGTYLADGCVKHHKGSSRVVFSFGVPEKGLFIDDVQSFFAEFGSRPSIEDRGTYVLLEFNHTPLARLFEHLCGRELSEKRVPSFMWEAPTETVDAFLDGWRADSRRTLEGKYISYSSARRDLVNAISWLARLNGRSSFINERGSKYRSVCVSKKGHRIRSDAMPAKPLLKLKAALQSTAWYYTPSARNKVISKERARKALQEILSKKRVPVSWDTATLISRIRSLLDSSLVASPILALKRAAYDGFVYDLSVPGTEAFFGGESPVGLHNTGHGGLCLAPWETLPVFVNGNLSLTTIENLYNQQADESTAVKSGNQEMAVPKSELFVPSHDFAQNKPALSRVKRISRRKFEGRLLKIHTAGGNEVTVTEDHPLLVLREGKMERLIAREAKAGDLVPCADVLPTTASSRPLEEIDLIEALVKSRMTERVTVKSVRDLLYAETKGRLAERLGVRPRAIDDYRRKDYLPLRKYVLLKDQNRSRRFLRFRKSPHAIPAQLKVDRTFARLLGFYLAEGSAGKNKVDFSFNSNDLASTPTRRTFREVSDSISHCFGVPVDVRSHKKYGVNATQVVAKDRLLGFIFAEILQAGNNSHTKRVPDFVFRMDRELMMQVLDAYFLGDGCAYVGQDGRAGYAATTSSQELAYGLYYLMLVSGYHVLIGRDRRNNAWRLQVAGGENFRRFVQDFTAGSALRGKVRKGDPGLVEKVPIEYVLARGHHQLLLTRMAEGNRFISRQVLDKLSLPRPNGIHFAEISEITASDHSGYVYDLYEVEGTHNFVHGLGIITSNCTLHADDVTSAIQRLTSKPMDVPASFIPFLDLVFTVRRIAIPQAGGGFRNVRRVLSVDEVIGVGSYVRMFKWDPATDKQQASSLKTSVKLARLARDSGTTLPELMTEVERRSVVLKWSQQREIRNFRALSLLFEEYRAHPREMYERARDDLGRSGAALSAEIQAGLKL